MENEKLESPPCMIPKKIFAKGEEPFGVRVTPYHKPCDIRQILNALDTEEIEIIRRSPFGKLVKIAAKPSFSGKFGRYIISKQLKLSKKHEAWFVFAGKPVRFSLGICYCNRAKVSEISQTLQKRSKKHINEKPYRGELFGTLKEVSISSVIRILKKKTVTEKELRVKYACLALLAFVILPTTHTPRISQDHTELIKDIDVFLRIHGVEYHLICL